MAPGCLFLVAFLGCRHVLLTFQGLWPAHNSSPKIYRNPKPSQNPVKNPILIVKVPLIWAGFQLPLALVRMLPVQNTIGHD